MQINERRKLDAILEGKIAEFLSNSIRDSEEDVEMVILDGPLIVPGFNFTSAHLAGNFILNKSAAA